MFESIPPSILRYIASFTYPISATVCKQWAQHLSLSAIQADFGLETVECFNEHIAKRIMGQRTTSVITNIANLKYISPEVKCLSVCNDTIYPVYFQLKNFPKLEKLLGYQYNRNSIEITDLQYLKYLSLSVTSENRNVSEIAKIRQLETLHIFIDDHFIDLSFIQQCENLETFKIYGNHHCNVDISQFCHNQKIKNLNTGFCNIQRVENFQYFTELKSLTIAYSDITSLNSIGSLVQLMTLKLNGNALRDISHVQFLVNLKNLEIIMYQDNIHTTSLHELRYLVQLERLVLQGFEFVENISFLQHLPQIKELSLLDGFDRVTDISHLRHLQHLETFHLHTQENRRITDFSYFAHLTNLKRLRLGGISNLEDTQWINCMNKLKYLDLEWCDSIRDIRGLPQLKSLQLSYLKSLRDLSSIACLPLDSLVVCYCDGIRDLSMLRNVKNLMVKNLSDIESIGHLVQLESLCIWHANTVIDISPIANLTNLNSLTLYDFPEVLSVSILRSLTQLQHLNIDSFPRIGDLTWLKYLKQLNRIELGNLQRAIINLNAIQPYYLKIRR
jgi:hypothetical protein